MSSRHRRRPRSHRRASGRAAGGAARRLVVTAGVLTAVAGVGTGVAVLGSGDGDGAATGVRAASDRAASSATPTAEEAAPTTASPSATESRKPRAGKSSAEPSPTRTARRTPDPAPTRVARPAASQSPTAASGNGTASRRTQTAATGETARVLELVNDARSAAGCSPLTTNEKLTAAAQKYSGVMAETQNMSHTGPDGSSVADRVEREGYLWSTVGENIARGQADADAVMDAWMNSQGHRENILNCSFKEIGIGLVKDSGGPWWTQNFGAAR
ncbi:CAP domain-containing protein [Streptomyces sp. GC420]|uniref:CAP domain-containing protein n=1 Tax=Streptomyces sp. GC420 TaxID=2697568 RepID=UPI001414D63C|nr:CAP domain-containing protein [Streptomyces sp. GC420]NBM16117.1 CAP domain-containing protein [Streptomyces sp. GC420]